MAKDALRRLANTPSALRLRHALGIRVPDYVPDLREAVSDCFVWRRDEVWETFFDVTHIAGILNPAVRSDYLVLVVGYGADGSEIGRREFDVRCDRVRLMSIADVIGSHRGYGTFAVFHLAPLEAVFGGDATCLAERGYVSYRRKTDDSPLRSYVHGNLYGMGARPDTAKWRSIVLPLRRARTYQPQVRLDDCVLSELALANYHPSGVDVEILPWRQGAWGAPLRRSIPRNGSIVVASTDLQAERVAIRAAMPMPRPLLFKHYASHFDVFHG